MMMRQIVPYSLAVLVVAALLPPSCASSGADVKDLTRLISQTCDDRMTTNDLAFILATHNYDATPKDGYVQVMIDGVVYKVVPNSANSSMADHSIIN